MNARFILSFLLILGLFLLPWWFLFLLVLSGLIYFQLYYEGILVLFVVDLIYGIPEIGFFEIVFPLTFLGLFILVIVYSVRDNFLVYN